MVLFKSLVVLDLETTGLPSLEHNTTKITELSLLGCEFDHIKDSEDFPRVVHKLTLCFHPMKLIVPEVTLVTRLDNDLLNNLKPFNEDDARAFVHFVTRLPSPVCIIAHNGIKFDFPILRRHLSKVNVSLPNDVYCADSLTAFREIYPKWKHKIPSQTYQLNTSKVLEKHFPECEKTPEHQKIKIKNIIPYKNNTNENVQIFDTISNKSVIRELFPEVIKSSPSATLSLKNCNSSEKSLSKAPRSYKLGDVYSFLHGKTFPDSHRAENDCGALLSCIIKCDQFFNWMSENSIIFNSIEPLF